MRRSTAFSAAAAAAAAAIALVGSACGTTGALTSYPSAQPTCSSKGIEPLVLVAQTVPTASMVPCIASYPAGWRLSGMTAHNGRATIKFDSDRGGHGALKVRLEHSCDVAGATEVPTDQLGTRRYERILSIDGGFQAVRSYRFAGGCVTYVLNFHERSQALVNEASRAVNLITRTEVDRRFRASTDGRAHL